ncbi:MAG: lipoate--protein ligase family protein [Desulfarculus sp.]|nr:lipoate--protein ligase family protein [Pseudomonadota bacterium]MBV1716389.1 lipoate--protein ligase family protein [Desulfarculus sp.]MBU4576172.1 lipoate--protein ligase family protein [Pseudomonadota bacterium]MBU4598538.1 lipoate--protein ligase family protein [Pseudomonadota bacterium]MBV1736873.1 lipoate--protein ligase family protein [Desulfarculus sp.]
MKQLRFIKCDYSYADFSTSISPAVEKGLDSGVAPNTVLLNVFSTDSITSGYLDDPEKAIDLEYCAQTGIVVRRRQNTGGAVFGPKGGAFLCLYLNPKEMGVPLTNIKDAFRVSLNAIAEALKELWGLEARYRPLNDVEVEGRKVVPSSARLENGILTLRLLINVVNTDRDVLRKAIITNPVKVQDKAIKDIGQRFTSLENELGREITTEDLEELSRLTIHKMFGGEISLAPGELTPEEEGFLKDYQDTYNSEEWFYGNSERLRFGQSPAEAVKSEGCQKAVAGLLRVTLLSKDDLIEDLIVTGDFHPSPYRVTLDVEDALRGKPRDLEVVRKELERIYARPDVEMTGIEIDDFLAAFGKAFSPEAISA